MTDEHDGYSTTTSMSAPFQRSFPTTIEPMDLTTASRLTLQTVAFPISLGLSEQEIARGQGKTRRQIQGELDMLRDELLGQG